MRPIIQEGKNYTALWHGEYKEFTAEADRIVIPLGTYEELQKAADACASK